MPAGKVQKGRDQAGDAFKRFLASQQEGLKAWAKKRSAQVEDVGMSTEMELLVSELLEVSDVTLTPHGTFRSNLRAFGPSSHSHFTSAEKEHHICCAPLRS